MALALLALGTPASASQPASFVAGCNDLWFNWWPVTRGDARSYAYSGAAEGYEWGGGCWNDNNHDDSATWEPNGEGPDCSGFTFKSWYERASTGDAGFRLHTFMQNTHGPYTAASFKNGTGAPNTTVAKAHAVYMDAFASTGHVGMIYSTTSYNQDRIIEAKCEVCGTGIWSETYRGNPDYSGARRVNWG